MVPYRLPYEPGDPVPPGYHVEERSNGALMWGGGLLWSAAYVTAVMVGPKGSAPGSGWVLVPVVGPFGALFQQRVECEADVLNTSSTEECSQEIVKAARTASILLVDGLVQTAGAALFLIGWGSTERQLVLDRRFVVTPAVGQSSYGVSVSGTF